MNKPVNAEQVPPLVLTAVRGAADLQATDLVVLDVGDVLGITDWFLIASASNIRQVRRIAEQVEAAVKGVGGDGPLRIEGLEDARWILMDFGIFVVHVFHDDTRSFYDIERLWSDVPRIQFEADGQPTT
ncbi:MAG: ribosome silencing factor [Actinomycetota bacterium]|nr:ribosome silencing factor [Actinomycetota bacterium]MEC9059322.1 ribosome silencing factor [Actinomycetota bacterium]MEC9473192.1 ribosome silencing factor [Actinomycetota bacterium]MEE3256154.1 ribosome silencing factor [Actinomycetota bacterium]